VCEGVWECLKSTPFAPGRHWGGEAGVAGAFAPTPEFEK